MLYIVWIWWLFRSEEVAAILPLGIELCLACRATAALLWCCEAKGPSVPQHRGVCCPSHALHVHLLPGGTFSKISGSDVLQVFSTPLSTPWEAWSDQLCFRYGFPVLSDPWGRGRGQTKEPARPFLVLKVLPGRGNTIQSVTGGVCFTGGWKEKGVKRRPRTPVSEEWVIPVWSAWGPAEIPALQFSPQLQCQTMVCCRVSLVWAKAAAGTLPTAETGISLSRGSPVSCVPSLFLPALVGTCFCFMRQQ